MLFNEEEQVPVLRDSPSPRPGLLPGRCGSWPAWPGRYPAPAHGHPWRGIPIGVDRQHPNRLYPAGGAV